MEYHQTADCPHCGKDSYQGRWEATFSAVKCMHCHKYFIYKPGKGSVKANKGDK